MFIKSKLLAWSAKSRKTPGMECKVQINSWHAVQSSFKYTPGMECKVDKTPGMECKMFINHSIISYESTKS